MAIYLFRKIVFNCRKATLLALKKKDGAATLWEKLQLFYHKLYCDPCRRFIRQSETIDNALADTMRRELEDPTYSLPDQVKRDLQAQIDRHQK